MPLALTPEFGKDDAKQTRWKAFAGQSKLKRAPGGLKYVVTQICAFLEAPAVAMNKGGRHASVWTKEGPWKPS